MDHEDEVQELENNQGYYLDGTPAITPDEPQVPQPGLFMQTATDVGKFLLAPLGWFRKKPTRNLPQQNRRHVERRNQGTQPPPTHRPPVSNGRPAKRQRGDSSAYGTTDMPPNVEFTEDERPRRSASFSDSYMTEDEDDDVDMPGPGPGTVRSTGINQTQTAALKKPNIVPPTALFDSPVKRLPLSERSDLTPVKTPSPQLPQVSGRKNTFLPLITNKSGFRHPLMEHTKVTPSTPLSTPLVSRKRSFDAVEADDDPAPSAGTTTQPKLFSTFPKSSEKLAGPPLSRFNALGKTVEASGVSKIAAPYYAEKRYEALLNQPTTSRNSRPSRIATFQPLKPLAMRNFLPSGQQSQITSFGRTSAKLDYSYVVPAVKTMSVSGVPEFTFQSSAIVPNGAIKKALEKVVPSLGDREGSETSRQSSQSPSMRRCRVCGTSTGNDGGDRCEVCEQVKMSKGRGAVDVSPDRSPKKVEASKSLQAVFEVDGETWNCSVCGTENSDTASSCNDCGKSKKDRDPPVKSIESARSKPDQQATPSRTEGSPSRGGEPPAKRPSVAPEKPKDSAPAPVTSPKKTPEPVAAAPVPAGFVDIWSKASQSKSWSCPDCMSSNAETAVKCAACEAPKPGTVAQPKAAGTAPPAISSTLFGGLQPTTALSITGQLNGVPSGGFSFGPAAKTTKTADAPPTFSFGQQPAPATSVTPTPSAFTGFGGLTNGPAAAPAAVPAAAPTASSFFAGIGSGTGTPSFIVPATSASISAGFSFGTPTTAAALTPFGGFAANTITTSSTPSSIPAPTAFTSGIPSFGAPAEKRTAPFQFGQIETAPTTFGFGMNGSGPTIFGQSNGVSSQPNGLAAPPVAAPAGLFGGAGFGAFGQQPMSAQNGQMPTGFASGLPQPGTFGGGMVGAPGTIGAMGPMGSPRRVLKARRNLTRN